MNDQKLLTDQELLQIIKNAARKGATTLNLNFNQLSQLPPEIAQLTNLQTLIAILLVSSNFLASDFIDEVELPKLLKAAENDDAKIFPVILNPCKGNLDLYTVNKFNNPIIPTIPLALLFAPLRLCAKQKQ